MTSDCRAAGKLDLVRLSLFGLSLIANVWQLTTGTKQRSAAPYTTHRYNPRQRHAFSRHNGKHTTAPRLTFPTLGRANSWCSNCDDGRAERTPGGIGGFRYSSRTMGRNLDTRVSAGRVGDVMPWPTPQKETEREKAQDH